MGTRWGDPYGIVKISNSSKRITNGFIPEIFVKNGLKNYRRPREIAPVSAASGFDFPAVN